MVSMKKFISSDWPELDASSGHGQGMVVGQDRAAKAFTNDEGAFVSNTTGWLSEDLEEQPLTISLDDDVVSRVSCASRPI